MRTMRSLETILLRTTSSTDLAATSPLQNSAATSPHCGLPSAACESSVNRSLLMATSLRRGLCSQAISLTC